MEEDNDDLNFRVVIKFRDAVLAPHLDTLDRSAIFSVDYTKERQQLKKALPGKTMAKLFPTVTEERVKQLVKKAKGLYAGYSPPNFTSYYFVMCDNEGEAKEILKTLRKSDAVELCYVETHLGGPPNVHPKANPLYSYQKYLNRAPSGIDAKYAWAFSGGDGKGNVRFIDLEQGWFLDHEDLAALEIPATGLNHWEYQDHGAAVLGIIAMQDNSVGGIGITPRAKVHVVSQWRMDGSFNTADGIMAALDYLHFGDILLLEAQALDVFGTEQMWPVEILDANFQAIRLANALGIIVIEPAGNGMYSAGNDLDTFANADGETVFNRSSTFFKDSGAVVVAGASSSVPHNRGIYSNYGSRIDCYAWGENVVTAGLFPRDSRGCTDTYSFDFGGTSSASAIIAGAAIAVQSITEAKYNLRLSPAQMRHILSNRLYGTKSENGHGIDKIGVMPDLRKIINRVLNVAPLPGKEPSKLGRRANLKSNKKFVNL
jgi:subtilase family protein